MSYTPTEWKSGDVVTSEKLNKLENGVASACVGLVVGTRMGEVEGDPVIYLDKTLGEIKAAWAVGPIFVNLTGSGMPYCMIAEEYSNMNVVKVKVGVGTDLTFSFATDNDGDDEYPYASLQNDDTTGG